MSQTPAAEVGRSELGNMLYEGLEQLPSNSRMSAEQLEVIYALAYAHVTQGQFEQALPIFTILATYGPTRKHYLAGLALCLQQCKRYEEAIAMYSLVTVLFPETPEPSLQVAECLLMLGRVDEAAQELGRVLRFINESAGRYDSLKPRVQVLLELVGKRMA